MVPHIQPAYLFNFLLDPSYNTYLIKLFRLWFSPLIGSIFVGQNRGTIKRAPLYPSLPMLYQESIQICICS